MAECSGHGIDPPPMARKERLGRFRELRAQPVEKAELSQKRLMFLDADIERLAEYLRWQGGL